MHDQVAASLLQVLTIALFFAVVIQIVASRLKLPAIVLLLAGGVVLGPEVMGILQPQDLGAGLKPLVSMAVAVILFEGGLSLNLAGFRQASGVIRRMLTVGVAVTWLGTSTAIYLLFDFSIGFSVLAASLVIVTGPTVVGPILRRARVKERLHHILHWEGVLIDPIGVFVALACFEAFIHEEGSLFGHTAQFGLRFAVGIAFGVAFGFLIAELLRREWIPSELENLFVLTSALVAFFLSDTIAHESGLLTVTIAGLVVGQRAGKRLKSIKKFKLEITELAIGVLFIILAARLTLTDFQHLGVEGAILIGIVMLVIRPLNVLLSARNSALTGRERAFLSFMAPRGIVAASMASLFTLVLSGNPATAGEAWFLEVFTYAVIFSTVILQGLPAGLMARFLKVSRSERSTWLLVSARLFARRLAKALQNAGARVVVVDVNAENIRRAKKDGLTAYQKDILDPALFDEPELAGIGAMISMTGNSSLDELACHRWQEVIPAHRLFRIGSSAQTEPNESGDTEAVHSGQLIWGSFSPLANLEGELQLKNLRIEVASDKSEAGQTDLPLFHLRGQIAEVEPDPRSPGRPEGPRIALIRDAGLAGFIRDIIWVDSHATRPEHVFKALLERIAELRPTLDVEAILSDITTREAAMTSYVGHGVCIPHAYADVEASICICGRLAAPLEPGSFGGHEVSLVFLLISPVDKGEEHLKALGDLARLVGDESFLSHLLKAESSLTGMKVVRDHERDTRETVAVAAEG